MGRVKGNQRVAYNEELIPPNRKEHTFERNGHIIIGHPDMINQCRRCKEWKNQIYFSPESSIDRYGRKTIRSICTSCASKDYSLHYKLRKIYNVRPVNCDFCKKPPKNNKTVQMDLDHTTKTFRGWLCNDHNTAFGKFNDDPFEMIKGIRYLLAPHHDKQKLIEELQTLIKELNDKME
jgi:hypothetical protein